MNFDIINTLKSKPIVCIAVIAVVAVVVLPKLRLRGGF